MPSPLKGIYIELGAETTGLDKALADVNKRARDAQNELKQVERLLKLDPKNTQLVTQKQAVLAKQVQATRDKLNALKEAQAQVEAQFARGDLGEEQYRAFQRELVKTQSELKKLEAVGKRTAAEVGASMTAAGNKMQGVGRQVSGVGQNMTVGLALPLLAAGVAAEQTAADFQRSMNQIEAATGASADEMRQMAELATQMGKETVFSSGEAADAILELTKAGMSPAQVAAGGLNATLNLAAAGELGLADAAMTVSNAMNMFSISADKADEVANALAGGANSSSANVEDLRQALTQVGPGAHLAGLNLQEVVAVLAEFADRGIKGSDAGTSFKRMLELMNKQTPAATRVMKAYGLSFKDANGDIADITVIAKRLQERLGGLSQAQRNAALQTIFGSDATRAASILMEGGEETLRKYIAATNDQGAAARMAAAFMDGMAGATERAAGSLETAAQIAGQDLEPVVVSIAGAVEELANDFTELSDSERKAIVVLAGIAGVAGPMVYVFGQLAISAGALAKAAGWVATKTAATVVPVTASGGAAAEAAVGYEALAGSSVRAAAGLETAGKAAPAVGAAAAGTIALGGALQQLTMKMNLFAANNTGEWLGNLAAKMGLNEKMAKRLGTAWATLALGPYSMLAKALDILGNRIEKAYQKTGKSTSAQERASDTADEMSAAIDGASAAMSTYDSATSGAADSSERLIRGLDGVKTAADGVGGTLRTAAEAQRDYERAILDRKAAQAEVERLEKAGKKGTEEWTRAVLDAADADQRAADAKGENLDAIHAMSLALVTGSSSTQTLTRDQASLVGELDRASGKVASLKAKLDTVPKSKRSKVEADIKEAEKRVEKIKAKIEGIPSERNVRFNVSFTGGGQVRAVVDGMLTQFVVNADGGHYDKPTFALIGETYEDEFVLNASRLRRGDTRQMSLLLDLLKTGGVLRSPRRLMPASSTALGGGGTSSSSAGVVNHFDMRGMVVREEADIDRIAEEVTFRQTNARRIAGGR